MKKLSTLFTFLALTSILFAQTVNWNGQINSDWNEAGNWSGNTVPISSDEVVIAAASNTPVLASDVSVQSLTIDSAAHLSLGIYTISLQGNWVNNGSIDAGESTVLFNGLAQQDISGFQTFFNLTIENSSGVQIVSGSDSLQGVLTLTVGDFNTNNAFTILSDATSTGSIGPIINGSISGDIVMQRYIYVSSSDWRFISSPVQHTTLEQIGDDFWTAGFTGSTYPSSSFISVYFYDEPNAAYEPATNITNSVAKGRGFMAYIGTGSILGVVEFEGAPVSGDVQMPVTFTSGTEGWSLVGNPYPSAINWDSDSIVKTGMDDAIYIWDPEIGEYTSYVDGIGTNGGSAVVASSQSFYVKANSASPQLTLKESCKTSASSTFFKAGSDKKVLSISVQNSGGKDETVLGMNATASAQFDASKDALKWISYNPGVPTIFTTLPGGSENYSINQFPEHEISVPLSIHTTASGAHTVNFSGISDFENISCIYLEDLFTGTTYDLRTTPHLSVTISDTTTVARFLVRFGAPRSVETEHLSCYNTDDGAIFFNKASDSLFNLQWKDDNGLLIAEETGVFQDAYLDQLTPGNYTVESTDHLCGLQIDSVLIQEPGEITADFNMSEDTLFLPASSTEIQFNNQSANALYYVWEFDQLGTSMDIDPAFSFDDAGSYTITLKAFQSDVCYTTSSKEVTVISTVGIVAENDINIRQYINGNTLHLFGEQIEGVDIRNVNGQLLYQHSGFSNQLSVDLSSFSHQLLLVTYHTKNSLITKKIVH
ncbi:MAG: hypothetical protein WDZ35_10375 [Crocinitomicaceae bacterium]